MKDTHFIIYTKQQGKQEFTCRPWVDYNLDEVTYHREDGPAIECINRYKAWYIDGKRCRIGGPAVESVKGKAWYIDDKLHRLDGPAREWADGSKEWWVNGVEYTEEEFTAIINKYKQLPKSIKISHKLWWVRGL